MKSLKILLLIGLFVSFYSIQLSYNGSPSSFLGECVINWISTGILVVESSLYLLVNTFFIIWFFFYKKSTSIIVLVLSLSIWFYLCIKYKGIIDGVLYLKTSIPYIVLLFIATIISFKKHYLTSSS